MSMLTLSGSRARRRALQQVLSATLALVPFAAWATTPSANLIRHGRYVVQDVAMCGDCHSARDQHGHYITARWLRGGPLDIKPTHTMPAWAARASNLIRLARRWSQRDWIRFLRTGIAPNGKHPRPPMPHYRLSSYDAQAVAAYIHSLKP